MTPTPIDFAKIDTLRRHMLLTVSNMASLLGVSRMTYYSWTNGGTISKGKITFVKHRIRQLLVVMAEEKWPAPAVIASSQAVRMEMLQAALEKHNLSAPPEGVPSMAEVPEDEEEDAIAGN